MATLKTKIMRGVYYAYFLRLASLPGVGQGFIMLAILIAITRFVSIGNVLNNLSQIGFSNLDVFAYNAVRTTEVWTLLLIGLFVFCLLSVRVSLFRNAREYSFAQV